jgi:hypothetical protein
MTIWTKIPAGGRIHMDIQPYRQRHPQEAESIWIYSHIDKDTRRRQNPYGYIAI